jgi:hypothetical protein
MIVESTTVAGERGSNIHSAPAAAEKSVINRIWLLLSSSDWSIILIGPGGLLLLVSPTYLLSQIQFYGWDWKKLNLDVKNIYTFMSTHHPSCIVCWWVLIHFLSAF